MERPGAPSKDTPAPLFAGDVVVTGAPGGGIAARGVVDGAARRSAPGTTAPARYENGTTWVFRIVENPEAYWIGGDADRVLLMDGTTLTALPVF
ncbi:hypothetical protein ACIGW0_09195 [Streptomyces bikiniensis]|uniref:Uncharacterized protein n=1 Tax=Streptomyces bikiniensis TaxID=1896 RepID=A0ABW8CPR7_STRBI